MVRAVLRLMALLFAAASFASAEEPQKPLPDLEISTKVTAKELRFDETPNVTVTFSGSPCRETVDESKHENLPKPVQPGVTYKNIKVEVELSSTFKDALKKLEDALEQAARQQAAPREGDEKKP